MQLRRSLGLFDVVLFFVIACTNLQWVAYAAASGAPAIPIWIVGCLAMFVPLGVVVMYLSARYPEEGGLYVWTKRAFGPFGGFISGWTYWTSNLPYFPALMYFAVGNAIFVTGNASSPLFGSPVYFIAASIFGFAIATFLNVVGLDIGKWLTNVGAASRWIITLLLIGLGIAAWLKFGSATPINAVTMRPTLDIKMLIFWSVIAFAWTGPESVPFLAGEVRDARRTIPRGLALAAPGIAVIYILGTASLLAILAPGHVNNLYGVMQGIADADARFGFQVITPIAAILVAISCLGSAGAWLGAVARLPFVAGIDAYLPRAFGRIHPKYGSPVVALLTQAGISALLIILGQSGSTVKSAYNILVSATVLTTMVPFLLVFAGAIKLAVPGKSRFWIIIASLVGLFTTISSIVLSVIPAEDEPDKTLAVVKVIVLSGIMIGSGVLVYYYRTPRAREAETIVSS